MQNTDTVKIGRLEVAAATDVGRERELNEDTVWGAALEDGVDNPWRLSALLVVADGMGGHDAGEVASNLAAQTVREIFASPQAELSPDDLSGQNLLRRVSESVQYVNRVVHARGEGNGAARPGTTLTVCLARAQEYVVGHVGDSRAYLIRRSDIEQVTEDDSLVAEAVRRGHMSVEEARDSQFRNQITKAVGLRPEVEPSVYYGHWQTGDVLLLCSDGLTEYVAADEMLQRAQSGDSLQQICGALIALANERGGHDNISVAAARFLPAIGASAASQPARKPKTWPPADVPARTQSTSSTPPPVQSALTLNSVPAPSQSTLPPDEKPRRDINRPLWILLLCICGALAVVGGLWFGMRGKASQEATPGESIIVAPAPQPARTQSTLNVVAQGATLSPIVDIWPDKAVPGEKSRRLIISCDRYQVRVTSADKEASDNRGAPLRREEVQYKGWVQLKNWPATEEAMTKKGYRFICRDKRKRAIGESSSDGKVKDAAVRAGRKYALNYEGAGDVRPIATFWIEAKPKTSR